MARKAKTLIMKDRNEEADKPLYQQIAELAHALWQERGSPQGSPEEDWFTAERQIKQRRKAEIVTLLQGARRA